MDIRYRLLIIDDNIDCNDEEYKIIRQELCTRSLFPCVDTSDGSNYRELIKQEYDMYLIDLNLVNDVSGTDIVDAIRTIRDMNRRMTDIILYSVNEDELKNAVAGKQLDGIYLATRKELIEKVRGMLDKQQRRSINPLALRGMLLHNFCDFEYDLSLIILDLYSRVTDPVIQRKILFEVGNHFDKGAKELRDEYAKWKHKNFIKEVLERIPHYVGVFKLIEILNFFVKLKLSGPVSSKEISQLHALRNVRNELSHNRIQFDKKGDMFVSTKSGIVFYREDQCKLVRDDVFNTKQVLNNIKINLGITV